MEQSTSTFNKTKSIFIVVLIADIILCLTILTLLYININFINYVQPVIIYNKYVEYTSLLSSFLGFLLIAILMLKMKYFGSTFKLAALYKKICMIGGLFHLVCGIALFFYYATSFGIFLVILGNIYRSYGYVQLINAVLYFGVFIYFKRSVNPLKSRELTPS